MNLSKTWNAESDNPDLAYIERLLSHPEITEYRIIDTTDIPFSEAVVEACRANRCGQYGTRWTCPPGVGELSEIKARILNYQHAVVFTRKHDLEDSFDIDGMREGMEHARDIFKQFRETLKRNGIPHMGLGCEGCSLCPVCSYPTAPCRHPDLAAPSVEACGIHVVNMSRQIGVRYNNGPNTVTYFCVLLFHPKSAE